MRKYLNNQGIPYDSVTTVTGIIGKPPLLFWYGKHGTAGCNAIKAESARRGNIIHGLLDQEACGIDVDLRGQPDYAKAPIEKTRKWIKEVELQSLASEMQVYRDDWQTAGCFDRLAILNGRLALLDWKTGTTLYDDFIIQMSAYVAHLYWMIANKKLDPVLDEQIRKLLDKQEGKIDRWLIRLSAGKLTWDGERVVASEDQPDQLFEARPLEWDGTGARAIENQIAGVQAYLACLTVFRWQKGRATSFVEDVDVKRLEA